MIGVGVDRIHAFDDGCLLVSFVTGETCRVHLRAFLGEDVFERTFPSHLSFIECEVDKLGNIVWRNGYTMSGSHLYAIAAQQATNPS